ncbi:MAG TPA: hypothetical protein VFB81_21935 [Myxococcales bacterium]|nr:hypothetical protein [Myxococcales bacterium]
MTKPLSVEGVRDMQANAQVAMQKLGEKLQKGEISKPDYDKAINFLQNANAKLDAYLAGAGAAGGSGQVNQTNQVSVNQTNQVSVNQTGGTGYSPKDTFDAAPTAQKPLDLSGGSSRPVTTPKEVQGKAAGAPSAPPEILDNPGGGSKPGIVVGL